MKLKSTQQEFLVSFLFALLLGIAGFYLEIQPSEERIDYLQHQNQALIVKIRSINNQLQNESSSLSSQDFYSWFSAQGFKAVTLQSLANQGQMIHIVLKGPVTSLMQIMNQMAASRFTMLAFSQYPSAGNELDLQLTQLQFSTLQPESKKVPFTKPRELDPIAKFIGVVHRHGQKFCVFERQDRLYLEKAGRC